jgi:hypothetical protein
MIKGEFHCSLCVNRKCVVGDHLVQSYFGIKRMRMEDVIAGIAAQVQESTKRA